MNGAGPLPIRAELAQVAGDLAAGQRIADIGAGERPAGRRHDARALDETARGERDIGGDADIGRGDGLGDPVVGRVGGLADHHHLHIGQIGRADRPRPVGDDEHADAEPPRDPIHLLAHRASIGVDVDLGQRAPVTASAGALFPPPHAGEG